MFGMGVIYYAAAASAAEFGGKMPLLLSRTQKPKPDDALVYWIQYKPITAAIMAVSFRRRLVASSGSLELLFGNPLFLRIPEKCSRDS